MVAHEERMTSLNLSGLFTGAIGDHLFIIEQLKRQQDSFECAAIRMTDCLLQGNKILWCGNGGSAAAAQHLAAELVGRFRRDRRPLASIALTTDSSVLTSIANDSGYERVFARQIEALCTAGDVVVGISTSGRSGNVYAALEKARELGACTIAMTGRTGGRVAAVADICLRIASGDAARVQEGHMLCGHMMCEWIELAACINHVVGTCGVAS
jgi:D-sedoheptulose 7-phosphate isomerase